VNHPRPLGIVIPPIKALLARIDPIGAFPFELHEVVSKLYRLSSYASANGKTVAQFLWKIFHKRHV
jgi:hypothetical protein